jgi:hypothetical protein
MHVWKQWQVAWLADLEACQVAELETWLGERTKAATRPDADAWRSSHARR